jgi:hypothetical protein
MQYSIFIIHVRTLRQKKGGVEESNLDVAIKEAIAPNKIIITDAWLERS